MTQRTSAGQKAGLVALVGVATAALLTPFLDRWEGSGNVGYLDLVGIPTNCRGNTENVVVGRYYSPAECAVINDAAAAKHAGPVLACTPALRNRPYQAAAAISLAYNIGVSAYCRSSADRHFDAGRWRQGCDAITLWNRAGGKVVTGLVNRRRAERQLCLTNLPLAA